MDFTVTRPFREIEEPNAGVGRLQTLDGGANRVVNTISDDEDFDVLDVLRRPTCPRRRRSRRRAAIMPLQPPLRDGVARCPVPVLLWPSYLVEGVGPKPCKYGACR